ncbi:MAG TPA: hypothetical protein DEP84_30540 [Chloroflexi bacterium]|nr:hypothetical protein [Chloroflexota bacterium]
MVDRYRGSIAPIGPVPQKRYNRRVRATGSRRKHFRLLKKRLGVGMYATRPFNLRPHARRRCGAPVDRASVDPDFPRSVPLQFERKGECRPMYFSRATTFLLLLAVLLAGCSGLPSAARPEDKTIKIGLLPITDVIPIYVAQKEGYFQAEGVTVQIVPVSSAAERDTFLQTGQIDALLNDLPSTVLTNAGSNVKIKVVRQARAAYPDEPQFWILSSKDSGITTIDQLKGVEVGISENSVIEYLTMRLLELEGVDVGQIKFTNVPQIATRLQLLSEGKLKAATLPDPLASLAVLEGANVVLTDAAHTEVSQSVLDFREDVLKTRPNTVKAFLRAYDKAVAAINADPAKYQNVLLENTRVPEPLKDKYTLPRFPEKALPSAAQFQDVVDWALAKGLIKSALSYEQLVDPSFLSK